MANRRDNAPTSARRFPAAGPLDQIASGERSVLMLQRTVGNRAVTALLQNRHDPGSSNILVGDAGSDHERNADDVARAVVADLEGPRARGASSSGRPGVMHRGEETTVRRATTEATPALRLSGGESGAPLPVQLERRLHSAIRGGRSLDGGIRPAVERATGADLSDVRVHDGTDSHELSGKLGARAFTYGNNVFFGSGEFDLSSPRGKELVAHELTHVAQGSSTIGRTVIHRAVQTSGGDWQTNNYGPVKDGAEIELEFIPNSKVNATKIGLIQKAKKIERGTNYDISARKDYESGSTTQMPAQKRKAQRSEGESHIDRDIKMNNPIYGAPNLGDKQGITATPMSKLDMSPEAQKQGTASNYQLGYRYKKGLIFKKTAERSAKLYDKPNMPGATNAAGDKKNPQKSEMTFETTAHAIDGVQKGQYYGSVSWGFKIDDGNGAVLEPLAVASAGNTTAAMKQVMTNWNQGEFDTGKKNPQIPIW